MMIVSISNLSLVIYQTIAEKEPTCKEKLKGRIE